MCLQFSSPPRLAEAEPYLRTVLAHAPNDLDPTLYLAVVLSLTPASGEEALATYNTAITTSGNVYTNAWAGAALARMLRRAGRTTEAQALEARAVYVSMPSSTIYQVSSHCYISAALDGLPPASVRMLLSDDATILEHHAVRALLNPEPTSSAGGPGVPLRKSTAVTA